MAATAILSGITIAACDVAWGGASIAFENPAPSTETASAETESVAEVEPLPANDLLYLVRFSGSAGRVRLVAAAGLVDGVPVAIGLPAAIDDAYRARFDSLFYASNRELTLHAGGHRVGSVVLDGTTDSADRACLSTAAGHALLPPGMATPGFAFAWAGAGAGGGVTSHAVLEADDRMRTYGPVLAENLLRRGGENRPYLAQRADLVSVPWSGDDRPAMAATYLVNDDLSRESPSNAASSLFVLARFDRTRGYVPEWSEVRLYGDGDSREAFTYLGAITTSIGRVDFVTRHTGTAIGLAASVDHEDERSIDWTEEGTCSALALLEPGADS